MSVSGLVLRFAIAYVGLFVVIAIAVSVFELQKASGFNAAALVVSAMWACMSLGEKNGRYFEGSEKVGRAALVLGAGLGGISAAQSLREALPHMLWLREGGRMTRDLTGQMAGRCRH